MPDLAGTEVVAPSDPPGDPVSPLDAPGWTHTDTIILLWLTASAILITWRQWWRLPADQPAAGQTLTTQFSDSQHDLHRQFGLVLMSGALLVWLSQIVGIVALQQITSLFAVPRENPDMGVGPAGAVILIGQYLGAGIALAFILTAMPPLRRMLSRDWRPIGLATGLFAFILVYPLCAGAGALTEWLRRFITDLTVDPVAHDTLQRLVEAQPSVWWWITLLGAAVGAPLIEEVIYRALLQNGLHRTLGSPWAAVALTSAIFTIVHAGAVELRGMPVLVVLSVALGVLYARTGRLLAPIALHAAFNIANIILAVSTSA